MKQRFKTVMIANRGEIAVRVSQTLRSLGIRSLVPYTEPDRNALHRRVADAAVEVGSYLDGEALIQAALEQGAQAVHPGYGFLSENADFAERCQKAGLIFIGPSPEAIRAMGDKLLAKKTMAEAGLPIVPSWSGPPSEAAQGAQSVGFPLLVKAAAGGGGKGMRRVDRAEELLEAVERAQSEARNAFGDDRIFLERFIEAPRHIEVQIFGDQHGNGLCFGERECSLQRRYQKIVEEAPSAAVDAELRRRLTLAGVEAVNALKYTGAGTVEFILDQNGEFYFLEVNTRLQVEHPVTEMVYGLDLVDLQIRVAQGEALNVPADFLHPRGWAIEVRIYAEDPDRNFMPSVGCLEVFAPPEHPNLRLDTGFQQGDTVSSHFDPMLAKLIAYGGNREKAQQTLIAGLEKFAVLGVTTNIPYLLRILKHPSFGAAAFDTQFLERERATFAPPKLDQHRNLAAALAAQFSSDSGSGHRNSSEPPTTDPNPWRSLGPWRSAP